MVNTQKKAVVQNLADFIDKNSNFAFIKFEKTTHQALESLRKSLRKSDSRIKVLKNSLLEKTVNKLAVKNKIFRDLKKTYLPLTQSTAVLTFGGDWSNGVKSFYEFIQKDKSMAFKMSLLDDKLYSGEETLRIASLPSKAELMAKIIGQLKTPVSKLTFSMKYNMQKFTYILSEKGKKN